MRLFPILLVLSGCVADVASVDDPDIDPPTAKFTPDANADALATLDAKSMTDANADASSSADTGATIDSGTVVDSGVVVDTGIDSGVPVLKCSAQNYAARDCVSQGQEFYVVESCGMNCWTTTPCAQKTPHCPQGAACKFTNSQNQIVNGVCK